MVLPGKFELNANKRFIFAGDFNRFLMLLMFSYSLLDASGGECDNEKNLLVEETVGLCGIWRIRNSKTERYTFRQNHTQVLFSEGLTISTFC